jgi:hypothetical protein
MTGEFPRAQESYRQAKADESWLQAKNAAQRAALDRQHSTIVRQRFQLRTLNELGRGLTVEEFLKARDALDNEQTVKRIGDPG